MNIIAIDPGTFESAIVILDEGYNIIYKSITENEKLLGELYTKFDIENSKLVIEMVASYGMPVGRDVFETCVWIGRFFESFSVRFNSPELVTRDKIKLQHCFSKRAKDVNIIKAMIDRFGNIRKHGKYSKGTKKNPGFFYEFKDDIWQAFALAVYALDTKNIIGYEKYKW